MSFVRTQVYLKPEHHSFLKEAAKKHGVSVAELLRCILDDYVQRSKPQEDFMQIVALGHSGLQDVSAQHDRYLAEALQAEHVR